VNTLQQVNQEMADIAAHTQRSLVRVVADERGVGAGTIWHSDGLIVTNAHVVGKHRQVKVVLPNGEQMQARVLATHAERDVAALMVEGNGLPAIEVGSALSLQAGDWVMALGHPWGVMNAATSGIVIGVGKDFPELPRAAHDWVAVSLHLRPGHSGGPLVDVSGKLVGMNTIMTGPDVGMAVAVDVVSEFLRQHLGSRTPDHII
jgi:serine protease Do